jgi:dolichyl-phosphate-mannose-protein mannosyltransferase
VIAVRLLCLWLGCTSLRWLIALPITEPRIFRDELLHWEMAKAVVAHQPFVLFGQPVDTPAVLYPVVLSVVFWVDHARLAFDLARGINAACLSAVVFPTYALAREFEAPPVAFAAAVLAALVPGGVYSALIMEESLYYPLFVLSCWLCFRVLTRGAPRDAVACGVALCLTYFAKPLTLLLVAAYGLALLAWTGRRWRAAGPFRERLRGLAPRLLPLLCLAGALVARHALAGPGQLPGSASEVVLSRFYAQEAQGPLVPPLLPTLVVLLALVSALALGTGVVPLAALPGAWMAARRDPRRAWFLGFTILVLVIYLLGIARHTLLLNETPKIQERYLFAVAPLLIVATLTVSPLAVSRTAAAIVLTAIVLTLGPLAHHLLPRAMDAPSLAIIWASRRGLGPGLTCLLAAGAAATVLIGAVRARASLLARVAWIAALPLVLNLGWYRLQYRASPLEPVWRTVRDLQQRMGPGQRVTVVVSDTSEAQQYLALYAKFWLDGRSTGYWTGGEPIPWYLDVGGPARDAAARTRADYLAGGSDLQAVCPSAPPVPAVDRKRGQPPMILKVPPGGCGAPPTPPTR